MPAYIPKQGDFVILDFDPRSGHEQMGRRPGIVVSVTPFNAATKLAICCPITNTSRKSPFHIPVPHGTGLTGFVMCEQMKSIDLKSRKMKFAGKADSTFLDEVLAVLDACIHPPEKA